jgi:hypothetical protein
MLHHRNRSNGPGRRPQLMGKRTRATLDFNDRDVAAMCSKQCSFWRLNASTLQQVKWR